MSESSSSSSNSRSGDNATDTNITVPFYITKGLGNDINFVYPIDELTNSCTSNK